jgi:hypothetical protein
MTAAEPWWFPGLGRADRETSRVWPKSISWDGSLPPGACLIGPCAIGKDQAAIVNAIKALIEGAHRFMPENLALTVGGEGPKIDYREVPGAAGGACGSCAFASGTARQPAPGRSGLVQTASSPEKVFKRQTTVWFSPRAI